MKLVLRVAFLGTAYCGYQYQPNVVSVQQKLNEAAMRLFGCECDVCGCSRTDSGVHANDFCVSVCKKGSDSLETAIKTENIIRAMNIYLPEDISVHSAEWLSSDFHPRYDIKYKEYIYRIYNSVARSPFEHGRSLFYPKHIDYIKLAKMNEAAKRFIGEHDFKAFMASGSNITDTKRTVIYSDVCCDGDVIVFRVAANGFLYNMVRIMAGTLLKVAEGKLAPQDIEKIILSGDRSLAGRTLPACGLYLNRAVYD